MKDLNKLTFAQAQAAWERDEVTTDQWQGYCYAWRLKARFSDLGRREARFYATRHGLPLPANCTDQSTP